MTKLRNLLILLALAYGGGILAYTGRVSSLIRAQLAGQYGESLTVKSVRFQDWYLQHDIRTGRAVFDFIEVRALSVAEEKDDVRGVKKSLLSMEVTVTGKWWPAQVSISHAVPSQP